MKFYDLDNMKDFNFSEDCLLFEDKIDKNDIDLYTIVKRNDETFAIGSISILENRCGVHKIDFNIDNEEETLENNIKCPVCGYEDLDSWEMSDEFDNSYRCGRCGAILQVQKNISVTYDSYVKQLPKVIELKGE